MKTARQRFVVLELSRSGPLLRAYVEDRWIDAYYLCEELRRGDSLPICLPLEEAWEGHVCVLPQA